jgi:predicted dehydrogenase
MNNPKEDQQDGGAPLPRVAVIGCGAAAREFCLPVLARYPEYRERVVLVDRQAAQAEEAAATHGIGNVCTDYQSLPFAVDAAIVMTPHHLHAEHATYFLRQGKPVFVEKPIGMTVGEVTGMLEAADAANTTLMVNHCRRLFPSYQRVRQLLDSGKYGKVLQVDISDGSPFEWNSVTSFYLQDARRAGGVFLDRGAHTVDLVNWWLGGHLQFVAANHDAAGGAEALMQAEFVSGQAPVRLKFSRLFKLQNQYTIDCEQAQIRGRLYNPTVMEIVRNGRVESIRTGQPALYHEYAWQLLDNFVRVVQGVARPCFTASDVAPAMALIDEATRRAVSFPMPWYGEDPNLAELPDLATAAS